MKKGYVHIYTGNGKGKTTASFGLALRALGAGFKVYIGQFAKFGIYSEIKAFKKFEDLMTIEQFGRKRRIKDPLIDEDIQCVKNGFQKVSEIINQGEHDLIILDEINFVISKGIIDCRELIELLKNRPEHVEIVITGRNASSQLIEFADLVSEINEVKHYAKKGVPARKGIEL